MVTRSLIENPEIYGKKVQAYDGSDSEFQKAQSMAEMRKFLLEPYTEKEKDQPAGQAKKNLLKDIDSPDEDVDQGKQHSPTKAKSKKRKHLPNWSSDEQSCYNNFTDQAQSQAPKEPNGGSNREEQGQDHKKQEAQHLGIKQSTSL